MLKNIQDMDLVNKKVVLRCDFNVPIKNGVVLDDSKIVASKKTIDYLLQNNCKIIILSHFGQVKNEKDKEKNSLKILIPTLEKVFNHKIKFCPETRGNVLQQMVSDLNNQEILLIENTRFEDLNDKLESSNDIQLSMYWASMGEMFINDAFGSAHRLHASTAGIARFIPTAIGFLMQEEIDMLDSLVNNPKKPLTIIMGGAKLDDKIELIENLSKKADYLLFGGGIANTFLKQLGFNVGFSLTSTNPDILRKVDEIMLNNKEKIMLPLDVVVGNKTDSNYAEYRLINEIKADELIYDVSTKTIEKYKTAIDKSSTIFINGTLGLYENNLFANGTKELLNILSESSAKIIFGGGDSVSSVKSLGYKNKFSFLSTGGGATLQYIANKTLPVIDYLKKEN